jgi:4-hydroxybenzoate polyprenyltransferase
VLKKAFDFFLFSSLYIALSCVVMIYQSYLIFDLPVNLSFLLFAFSGTIVSYNFHWYLTPSLHGQTGKAAWSSRNKNLHAVLFVLGTLGALYYGYQLLGYWEWLIATAFITFLYSAPKIPFKSFRWLRQIAIGKTIFLAYSWTHVTAFLPIELSGVAWDIPHYLFVISRFFLIYPICILFDLRDRESDKKEGIRSMITEFSHEGISILFWGSLLVFLITTIAMFYTGVSLPVVLALLIPGVILSALYSYSKKNASDYYYLFVLDGLMMLSGLLLLFIHF